MNPTILDQLTTLTVTPTILRVRATYWRGVANRNARACRMDQAYRLHVTCDALDRQAEEMDRSPLPSPDLPVVALAVPALRPVRLPAKSKPVARLGAEQFWAMCNTAVDQIRSSYGDNWKCIAPVGETILVTVPLRLRSFKGARGSTIRYRADTRIPAARFWTDGKLPDGLTLQDDHPRETAPRAWGDIKNAQTSGYKVWQDAWAKQNNLTFRGNIYLTAAEVIQADATDAARSARLAKTAAPKATRIIGSTSPQPSQVVVPVPSNVVQLHAGMSA